jgi:hypothetical protein
MGSNAGAGSGEFHMYRMVCSEDRASVCFGENSGYCIPVRSLGIHLSISVRKKVLSNLGDPISATI